MKTFRVRAGFGRVYSGVLIMGAGQEVAVKAITKDFIEERKGFMAAKIIVVQYLAEGKAGVTASKVKLFSLRSIWILSLDSTAGVNGCAATVDPEDRPLLEEIRS